MDKRIAMTIAASLALGAGAGYFAGARSGPPAVELPLIVPASRATPQTGAADANSSAQAPARISTIAEVLQLQGDFAQSTALYLLASQADARGIERLLQEAAGIKSESERRAASGIFYSRLAELDPETAVERIMRAAELDFGALQTVFQSWSRLDLQRALARAAKLDERSKAAAVRAILYARSELSTAQREAIAREYNVRIADPAQRVAMDVRNAASAERSWRAVLAVKDPMQRNAQLAQLAALWVRQSPEAALRAVEQIDEVMLRSELLVQTASAWGQKSPQDALDWAMGRRPSQERAQLLTVILQHQLKEDPRATLEQLQQLSSAERQQVLPGLLSQWAQDDVQAVVEWLSSVKDRNARFSANEFIARAYATRSPDEALRWAATLPKSESHYAFSIIFRQVAESDISRGVAMINTLQDPEQRDDAAAQLAQSWASRDPAAAAAWATRLPPTKSRASIVGSVFDQWAMYDAPAALQQFNLLTDQSMRDGAAAGLIRNEYLEPAVAEQLFERIDNPELRREAAIRLFSKYRDTDPQRAQRYRDAIGPQYSR